MVSNSIIGLSDAGPHTPNIINSIAEDPPSVMFGNILDVSIHTDYNIFKKESLGSLLPTVEVYPTTPSVNLVFPISFILLCIAGCIGNDIFPIAKLITSTEFLSFLLEYSICACLIADGKRAL